MYNDTELNQIRRRYQHFAEHEAHGVSSRYEALAWAVTQSEPLLRFIAALPPAKQQPNLVFASVRHLFGVPTEGQQFVQLVDQHAAAIRAVVLARSTQTNEPARCATLLPVLSALPQPLALLEVGASAGLCLLLDQYGYDYGDRRLSPPQGATDIPVFPCQASAATPLPEQLPTVVWRAGIDLHPLDLTDPDAVAWLETLVWPDQEERAARLRAAIRTARLDPPQVVQGDLLTDLPAVAAAAPVNATLVVFHSAVLAYVARDQHERFSAAVRELGAVWISNEAPQTITSIAAKLPSKPPPNRFVLAANGEPVAYTGPHGQSIEWLA